MLSTVNSIDPNQFNDDLLIFLLYFSVSNILATDTIPPMGAILILLLGLPRICQLYDLLTIAALVSEEQEAAFEVPPIRFYICINPTLLLSLVTISPPRCSTSLSSSSVLRLRSATWA
ncbi:hypothetical protein BC938DRAFT_479725 [Jimgerdemannia flammicorona]|uniref:Uncharacterized protein n=1 Tax=Jimgerdemannia flammicorona TaxID=994334 RepID=A0A433QXU7_9FUNG|nr:hypothetical protein BC938DRAFT_479725 [Jimgerdemannia flammicorona]